LQKIVFPRTSHSLVQYLSGTNLAYWHQDAAGSHDYEDELSSLSILPNLIKGKLNVHHIFCCLCLQEEENI